MSSSVNCRRVCEVGLLQLQAIRVGKGSRTKEERKAKIVKEGKKENEGGSKQEWEGRE